jgi:hypothetical protein
MQHKDAVNDCSGHRCVCIYECMYVCMYVCIQQYMYAFSPKKTCALGKNRRTRRRLMEKAYVDLLSTCRARRSRRISVHSSVADLHVCTYICMHIHVYLYAIKYVCIFVCICVCIRVCMNVRMIPRAFTNQSTKTCAYLSRTTMSSSSALCSSAAPSRNSGLCSVGVQPATSCKPVSCERVRTSAMREISDIMRCFCKLLFFFVYFRFFCVCVYIRVRVHVHCGAYVVPPCRGMSCLAWVSCLLRRSPNGPLCVIACTNQKQHIKQDLHTQLTVKILAADRPVGHGVDLLPCLPADLHRHCAARQAVVRVVAPSCCARFHTYVFMSLCAWVRVNVLMDASFCVHKIVGTHSITAQTQKESAAAAQFHTHAMDNESDIPAALPAVSLFNTPMACTIEDLYGSGVPFTQNIS